MIRKLEESDLPRIMQIWLSANKEAHGFIKESYWDENFEAVKAALPCAKFMCTKTQKPNLTASLCSTASTLRGCSWTEPHEILASEKNCWILQKITTRG